MGKMILVRYGQSLWNIENIFTGWTDIDLVPVGIAEEKKAGELIKKNNIAIDLCCCSYLKRAIRTAWLVLESCEQMHVNTQYHWKLNESHYGTLQGKNKDEVLQQLGKKEYWEVRRGYATSPPKLDPLDLKNPKFDANYKNIDSTIMPLGESLEETSKRVVNYYLEVIVSQIVQGKTVLISAHENSLRALIGYIKNTPPNDMPQLAD